MNEQELIKCCQQRKPKAQEALYLRYADKMFRVCQRYIKKPEDAQDILITSFTKIFESIKNFTYRDEGSLEAWIRKIVINYSLMWLRKHHNFSLTETLDENLQEPDLSDVAGLGAEDILFIISKLPTGYRTVFSLNVIDGYTHEEISKLLNITESTSRSQLFKAKSLLKKTLLHEGYYYGT